MHSVRRMPPTSSNLWPGELNHIADVFRVIPNRRPVFRAELSRSQKFYGKFVAFPDHFRFSVS